jgi:S1-C subfamily serine protease
MTRRGLGSLSVCLVLCGARRVAAQGGNVPADARALVTHVVSHFGAGTVEGFGAGIIIGAGPRDLYVATASHVVVVRDTARLIWVIFSSGDSVQGRVMPGTPTSLDLAVLRVSGDPARILRLTPQWNRLGNVRSLRSDDPVSPVGCPQGVCWQAPTPPDRIVGIDRLGVLFQSAFVQEGSSGGALFNSWWEVVGMVTEVAPPRANAIPIDQVLAQAKQWGAPVALKHASVPRGGYRTTLGIAWLGPVNAESDQYPDSQLGSGRATLVQQVRPGLAWHASLLRLAPDNLLVRAGMVGGQLILRRGRFTAAPFLEAGLGRVEGRYDAGGYYGSGGIYVPLWTQQKQEGIGVGGGVDLSAVVVPHVMVQALAGTWSFSVPDSVPKLPSVFLGAGLRWAP